MKVFLFKTYKFFNSGIKKTVRKFFRIVFWKQIRLVYGTCFYQVPLLNSIRWKDGVESVKGFRDTPSLS